MQLLIIFTSASFGIWFALRWDCATTKATTITENFFFSWQIKNCSNDNNNDTIQWANNIQHLASTSTIYNLTIYFYILKVGSPHSLVRIHKPTELVLILYMHMWHVEKMGGAICLNNAILVYKNSCSKSINNNDNTSDETPLRREQLKCKQLNKYKWKHEEKKKKRKKTMIKTNGKPLKCNSSHEINSRISEKSPLHS